MMMTLQQALPLLPGAVLVGAGDVAFERVHSDTRSLRPGDLFVALRGERFDAHDFLARAQEASAATAPVVTLMIVRKNTQGPAAHGATICKALMMYDAMTIGTACPAARVHGRAVPIRKSISPPPR